MISAVPLQDPRNPLNPHTTDPAQGKCPPLSWLGWGLDLTSTMPFDISSITASVLRASSLIEIDKESHEQSFSSGVTWAIPDNVSASDSVSEGQASLNLFEDGIKASSSISADASLSGKYMAVTAGASVSYSIAKMFQASYSYALFSYNQKLIQVSLDGWADNIKEENLKRRLSALPQWNPNNADTVGKYRRFFRILGTHIITGTSYGGRLQLMAWASNSSSEEKQNFGANIAVEYNGLVTSGKFDASIKTSSEYSTFQKSSQRIVSCKGGNSALAGTIASSPENPDIYASFQSWVGSSLKDPAIMSMQTVALWDIMFAAIDKDIVNRAGEIENAFHYIVSHPAKHVTKCRFVINSDWGEFGLLTPGAFINPQAFSTVSHDYLVTMTKLRLGQEGSMRFERGLTMDFEILNDGSPVDIMLSHGNDGPGAGKGQCAVTIDQMTYENAGIKPPDWNAEWFYKCEVNPNEAT